MRTILDGLAMAAYFNLFAAAVALYKPRLLFPCYPPAIIKAAEEPPTKAENRFYWLWICFGEWLPLLLYGAVSTAEGGTTGFWRLALTGYIQWMIVNFCDLFFLDLWLIQKKAKRRFVIPGTEGDTSFLSSFVSSQPPNGGTRKERRDGSLPAPPVRLTPRKSRKKSVN